MSKSFLAVLAILWTTAAQADCRFTLNFAHGSAGLSAFDALLLRDLARAYPEGPVSLSAHADDDGSPAQNSRIAQARARAVISQLRRSGLKSGAIEQAISLAADWEARPAHASSVLNRRVELFIEDCDPSRHPEARVVNAPSVAIRGSGRVRVNSPLLPSDD